MTLLKLVIAAAFICSSIYAQAQCETDAKAKYNCQSVTACADAYGVCECANGKRCVWTNDGTQVVNCPCFDPQNPFQDMKTRTNDENLLYCLNKFITYNCGYETTCSKRIDTGTCKCQSGKFCVWTGTIEENCPCDSAYPTVAEYIDQNLESCKAQMTAHRCSSNKRCVEGIGSCSCADGSLCAFGPTYDVGCPCPA